MGNELKPELAGSIDPLKIKLFYKNIPGRGKEIHALLGQEFNCAEFTKRDDVAQPITYTPQEPIYICSEPWIQFSPKEWDDLIELIFRELVNLWNTKYGHNN